MRDGQDFTAVAGDSVRLRFAVTDEATGLPLDLSSYSLLWGLSRRPDSSLDRPDALLTLAVGSGVSVATLGLCDVVLPHALTASLQGTYRHQLRSEQDGVRITFAVGRAVFLHSPL